MHHLLRQTLVGFAACLFLAAPATANENAASAPDAGITYFESAVDVQVATSRSAGATRVSFHAHGRLFDLRLTPSHVASADFETLWVEQGEVETVATSRDYYRGSVAGEEDSSVALSIDGGTLEGLIRIGSEIWFLDSAARLDSTRSQSETAVFRLADTNPGALGLSCGGVALANNAATTTSTPTSTRRSSSPRALREGARGTANGSASVTLVADYEMASTYGGFTGDYLLGIINQVDVIFETDHDISLDLLGIIAFSDPNDPFTSTRTPGKLLQEFANYRSAAVGPAHDAAATHLVTSRNLSGSVQGIAFLGTLCSPDLAASLSENLPASNYLMVLVVAHELGHVFGAQHDGEGGSPCAGTPFGSIMWPSVQAETALQFSQCSVDSIAPVVAASGCADSPLPETCGNNVLDVDEDCDDGNNLNNDCCAYNCLLEVENTPCTVDGNPCTQDYCDGAGICLHPPRPDSPCHDGDICTEPGECDDTVCIPSNIPFIMTDAKSKASLGAGVDDDSLSMKVEYQTAYLASPPTSGGFQLEILNDADETVYFTEAPPESFSARSGGTTFKLEESVPGGLSFVKIKFRGSKNLVAVKIKASGIDLSGLAGQGTLSFRVQIGDNDDGDCASALALDCAVTATRVKCSY